MANSPNDEETTDWIVKSMSKLWVPQTSEYVFMHANFEPLKVKDGTAIGKLLPRTSIAAWKEAGFMPHHAVLLRSVTNDVTRLGMYTAVIAEDDDTTHDCQTLHALRPTLAEEFVKDWKEGGEKMSDSEEFYKEYKDLLSYTKPDAPPEPKNSKNWYESTTIRFKDWRTAAVKPERKPREFKKERNPADDEPELTGVRGVVKAGQSIKDYLPTAPKQNEDKFDMSKIVKGVNKRRRQEIDDYKGQMVTVPAWLFDAAMGFYMKHKVNPES